MSVLKKETRSTRSMAHSPRRAAGWAKKVGAGYQRLPVALRAILWAVFFTGFAGYSALLIRQGLKGETDAVGSGIGWEPAFLPEVIAGPKGGDHPQSISREQYRLLLKAQAGLDSLQAICAPCYQVLLARNPGFEDSLRQIIRVYQNQFVQPIQSKQP